VVGDATASVGSLYHFFPGGKEELAADALRWSGAAYQALVEAVIDAHDDVVAGVRACFDAAAATLRDSGYADACPIAGVALEVASTDDALRQVTHEVFEHWLSSACLRFEAAGIEPARARDLAVTLVAALEGGFLLCRAARDTAPMESIGRMVTELVADALGVSPRAPRAR
jgi:AcrR family transcriptional regulator